MHRCRGADRKVGGRRRLGAVAAAAAAVAAVLVANQIPLMAEQVETEMETEPMVLLHQTVVADLEQ